MISWLAYTDGCNQQPPTVSMTTVVRASEYALRKGNMKNKNVIIGETYKARVSGQCVKVRIVSVSPYGWDAVNLKTKRQVRIKTVARLSWPGVRKEYGIGDFLSYISGPTGLVAVVKKVAAEEKTMAGPLATEKIQ